jgi:hypothetical protein
MRKLVAAALFVLTAGALPTFAEPLQGRVVADGADIRHPKFSFKVNDDRSTVIMTWHADLPVEECEAKINDAFFARLTTIAHDAFDQWTNNLAIPAGHVDGDAVLRANGAKVISVTQDERLTPVARMFIESISHHDLAAATKGFDSLTVHFSYERR